MIRTRIIPALLLRNQSLVKTVRFGKFSYVGDPCNTVRIFNELEVDELLFLDITASLEKRPPNFQLLNDIASECFMPMGFGGGIKSAEDLFVDIPKEYRDCSQYACNRKPKLYRPIGFGIWQPSCYGIYRCKKKHLGTV